MDLMRWIKLQWDRAAAAVLVFVGLVTLIIGAVGTSHALYPAEQLPYMISGGVLGIFLLGLAGVLYLSADMRDEWRKLDKIDDKLDSIDEALQRLTAAETTEVDTVPATEKAAPRTPPARAASRRS